MEDLDNLFINKDNFGNLTDKEFDWLLENEAEFVLEFNKRLRNRTIVVDGRRIKNCSNARKWAIGFFNKRRQVQRQREFDKDVRNGEDIGKVRIVSEGDSWFNYPTKLQEVIDNLFDEFSIYSLGYAGDWLANIYKENEYSESIRLYRPDVFLISGGGNDLVGSRRMETLLKKYKKNATVTDLIIKIRFDKLLEDFRVLYKNIFNSLTEEHPNLKIICHGYDYPFLDGKEKKWFGKPMRKKGIMNIILRNDIAKFMMDAFNNMLEEISNDFSNVHYLDLRNVVDRDNWKDELHPNNDGFKQVSNAFKAKIIEITYS